MSDIINELQESFEDTNKQLSKLSADLNKLTKYFMCSRILTFVILFPLYFTHTQKIQTLTLATSC